MQIFRNGFVDATGPSRLCWLRIAHDTRANQPLVKLVRISSFYHDYRFWHTVIVNLVLNPLNSKARHHKVSLQPLRNLHFDRIEGRTGPPHVQPNCGLQSSLTLDAIDFYGSTGHRQKWPNAGQNNIYLLFVERWTFRHGLNDLLDFWDFFFQSSFWVRRMFNLFMHACIVPNKRFNKEWLGGRKFVRSCCHYFEYKNRIRSTADRYINSMLCESFHTQTAKRKLPSNVNNTVPAILLTKSHLHRLRRRGARSTSSLQF